MGWEPPPTRWDDEFDCSGVVAGDGTNANYNPRLLLVNEEDLRKAKEITANSLKTTAEIFSHVNEDKWTAIVRKYLTDSEYKMKYEDSWLAPRILCGGPENRQKAYLVLRDAQMICVYQHEGKGKLFVCNGGLHNKCTEREKCRDEHPYPAHLIPKYHLEPVTDKKAGYTQEEIDAMNMHVEQSNDQ